jgi:hypothetical protein
LHTWALDGDATDAEVLADAVDATGAVIWAGGCSTSWTGRTAGPTEMGYGAAHAAQTADARVTRNPPETVRLGDRFTFVVDGLHSAVSKAIALAEDRDVVVMGGGAVIRGCLDQGLLDELRLHLAPVILGTGTPLWDGNTPRTLRQLHVRVSGHATHLTYRVA